MEGFNFRNWSEHPITRKDYIKLEIMETMPPLLSDDKEIIVVDPDREMEAAGIETIIPLTVQ